MSYNETNRPSELGNEWPCWGRGKTRGILCGHWLPKSSEGPEAWKALGMKETECLGVGFHCTPQWKLPNSLVLKASSHWFLLSPSESKPGLEAVSQVLHGRCTRRVQRVERSGAVSSFPHMMILCGAPLLATCEALSLGLRSLQVHSTT